MTIATATRDCVRVDGFRVHAAMVSKWVRNGVSRAYTVPILLADSDRGIRRRDARQRVDALACCLAG